MWTRQGCRRFWRTRSSERRLADILHTQAQALHTQAPCSLGARAQKILEICEALLARVELAWLGLGLGLGSGLGLGFVLGLVLGLGLGSELGLELGLGLGLGVEAGRRVRVGVGWSSPSICHVG